MGREQRGATGAQNIPAQPGKRHRAGASVPANGARRGENETNRDKPIHTVETKASQAGTGTIKTRWFRNDPLLQS